VVQSLDIARPEESATLLPKELFPDMRFFEQRDVMSGAEAAESPPSS
jgi:hypothetical protein